MFKSQTEIDWLDQPTSYFGVRRVGHSLRILATMGNDQKLVGLVAAPHTPFDKQGKVALDVIDQQAVLLKEQGVIGGFVCGTTGEGASLSSAERRAVAERWGTVTSEEFKVIVHVGHSSVEEACELARHAEECGAWGISIVAPFYFKPGTVEELTVFCRQVCASAPRLPFYYYHSPGITGVRLSPADFLRHAGEQIPNLRGVKFNDGDLFEYQRCLAIDGGRFDIPFGVDEALIGGIASGAMGAVGSTYNYAAPLYLDLIEAFQLRNMDAAREYSQRAVGLVEILTRYGAVAAGKAIMSLHGIHCGDPRSPIPALSGGARVRLLAEVEQLNVLRQRKPAFAV